MVSRRCSVPPGARRGAAVVELALLAPLLCVLFVAAVDFSRVFYFSVTVNNCARNGALYGCGDPAKAIDTTGIATAAKLDATNLNSTKLQVSSKTDSSTSPTYVDVTVTYPFTTFTSYPGIPSPITLTRTVRARVSPYLPN